MNAICRNPKLSRLDDSAAQRYAVVLSAADENERRQFIVYHDSWLSSRNGCGTDVSCLTIVYKNWLTLLNTFAH